MPEGGTLRLATQKEGDHVVLSVADTGKGIDPDDLQKIFEPFFTKKVQGMGFGLAIVQRIVEDHKGRITCQSEPGQGTTFKITLPLSVEQHQV